MKLQIFMCAVKSRTQEQSWAGSRQQNPSRVLLSASRKFPGFLTPSDCSDTTEMQGKRS